MSDSHRAFDRLCFLLVWAPGWPPEVLVGGRWGTQERIAEKVSECIRAEEGAMPLPGLNDKSHNGSWAQMTCRKPGPEQGML